MRNTRMQFKIDKNIPVPLYYQLKQEILETLKNGDLKPGDALPTESELCADLEISRVTVRQALNELVSDGYLYRAKGKGTFVSLPKVQAGFFQKLQSFDDEMRQKGLTPSTKVLALSVIAAVEDVNTILKLPKNAKLIYLERLRFVESEPIVKLQTYFSYEKYASLLSLDFSCCSLYAVMDELCGTRVSLVQRQIEAVTANQNDIELLKISPKTAICMVRTVGKLADGFPVEYSVARYRGDMNTFTVELYR